MLDLDQGRTNLFAAVRGDKMTMRPFYKSLWPLVKDAGVGRAFSRVCMFVCLPVCLFVCLFVRALKENRLELSTPNLVHVYSIAIARHALTQRSKGQRYGSQDTKTVSVARLLMTTAGVSRPCATCGRCRRGSACQYDCLCFLVITVFIPHIRWYWWLL